MSGTALGAGVPGKAFTPPTEKFNAEFAGNRREGRKGLSLAASATITKRRNTSPRRVGVLVALGVFVSTLGFFVAYFAGARIQGNIYYRACSCGMTPATVSGGKVILA